MFLWFAAGLALQWLTTQPYFVGVENAFTDSGHLNVTRCVFNANYGQYGGGIGVLSAGHIWLKDSFFFNNVATLGGGGVFVYLSGASIHNCGFHSNRAPAASGFGGGGVAAVSSLLIVEGSAFTGNEGGSSGSDGGGGIAARATHGSILDCTFNANTAYLGGAISLLQDSAFGITNTTMFNHVDVHQGGALYSYTSYAPLRGVAMVGNQATSAGAAVLGHYENGFATCDRCLIQDNVASQDGESRTFLSVLYTRARPCVCVCVCVWECGSVGVWVCGVDNRKCWWGRGV